MATLASSSWQHNFVKTNAVRLHYVSQGDGELIILLHGCLEFWYSWRHQIPSLARYFKVVVPDLRGYNDSEKPASGYDLDTLSTDVQGLISGLGYQQAHLVGHDLGGAIAWHFAQRFPKTLDRLAILNAPHPYCLMRTLISSLDQLWRNWYFLFAQVPTLPEWLLEQNLGQLVQNLLRDQAIRKGAFTAETARIYQAALEKPGVLTTVLSCLRQLASPQILLRYSGRFPQPVKAPTLVLWGEEDQLLNQKLTEGLEEIIKAPFKLKLVPSCGHWIQQEVPQTVNRELLEFLRGR